MSQQLYSVDQVAAHLGLHVRTVRNYVRDGRLRAVRIGKQYRIAREDVEAFTGQPVQGRRAEVPGAERRAEVSSVVRLDGIGPDEADRLTTLLVSAANGPPGDDEPLHIQTVYDRQRAFLTIMLVGGLAATARLFPFIETLTEATHER